MQPSQYAWRDLRQDGFWQQIPAWHQVTEEQFRDWHWQEQNAVTSIQGLGKLLGDRLDPLFRADVEAARHKAPMALRITPYTLALIDWDQPQQDPLRRQFLPMASEFMPDHPMVGMDSLHERDDAPVAGLTHRYKDKALFLALDVCPVYCRFCTRSYAVGPDTEAFSHEALPPDRKRWLEALHYIQEHPEIEDIVLSGGDAFRLRPEHLRELGDALLDIPHLRRMRVATKGIGVIPMRIRSDPDWLEALTALSIRGRREHKEVALHTHINHPHEITLFTQDAVHLLTERGIPIRNQSVLLHKVNDDHETMRLLMRRCSWIGIAPYYVFAHDLVPGTEDLRTSLAQIQHLEIQLRGETSGFRTPLFIVDLPGGGGKRPVHSCLQYDRALGISVFEAPAVKSGKFIYVDPLHCLSEEARQQWQDSQTRQKILAQALA